MGVKKRPVSPRQKMINLMYVVLMAMLALNVSSDVLNGFSLVEESLNRSTTNSTRENQAIYADFDEQFQANPVKVKEWFDKARTVKRMSDSLYNLASELKQAIVRQADGRNGNVKDIKHKDDLEAATSVMLAPGTGRGKALYDAINQYREQILCFVTDSTQRSIIQSNLSTHVPNKERLLGRNWQEYMFEDMPVAAAITLLTKLQSDVRYAEGEVLHTLVSNIDVNDIRVNQLSAFVIPNAQTIVQGSKFSAHIIMAAVDTTKRPTIYIGGRAVDSPNGFYEFVCNRTGDFTLDGHIEMRNGTGELVRRDFSQKYSVVAPTATVSADLMNVLYAGYTNPVSVSVPGVPSSKIIVNMEGGTLQSEGNGKYIARPTTVGKDAVFTVLSTQNGRPQEMGKFAFRVRALPDPTAYIAYTDEKGNTAQYRGGGRSISKAQLLGTQGIGAAIDDGLLNIQFRVLGFETVFFDNMGNAVPEVSQSAQFTERQKELFRRLNRGRRFNISRVRAVGPDGVERTLPYALEVIVK